MTENKQSGNRRRWGLLLVVQAGLVLWCQTAHGQTDQTNQLRQSVFQSVAGQADTATPPTVGDQIISTPSAVRPFSLYPERLPDSQDRAEMASATHPDLASIISRLAISTLIVLGLCVGSLLLFRKFKMNGFANATPRSTTTSGPEIRVEATLRLRGNRSLEIVRADNARLVIVSDSSGVKSVLPIGVSFKEQINKCETGNRTADVEEALFEVASLQPTAHDRVPMTRL